MGRRFAPYIFAAAIVCTIVYLADRDVRNKIPQENVNDQAEKIDYFPDTFEQFLRRSASYARLHPRTA